MSRLPRITGRQALTALRRGGWELDRVRGSHHYLRKGTATATVPVHSGRTLPLWVLVSILDQTGLSVDELVELLKD